MLMNKHSNQLREKKGLGMQCTRSCPFISDVKDLHMIYIAIHLLNFLPITKFDLKSNQHFLLLFQVLYVV